VLPIQRQDVRPLLVTGATGTLGRAFGRICTERAIPHVATTRQELDIADGASIAAALERLQPWAIVNTSGYVRVDEAETDRERCFRENALGPTRLARACAAAGIQLVTFSSDLVFDGRKGAAYVESDAVAPLNVYGASKASAEDAVLAELPSALVVRTSAFFGPWDRYNFVFQALAALRLGERFRAATDLVVSPTYVPDLVHTTLDLLIDAEAGIWHLANVGSVSWFELAHLAGEAAALDTSSIEGQPANELGFTAQRPRCGALASERGWLMPSLADALSRYVRDVELEPMEVEAAPA
jgi:dTDP-4-dehydrorhamnose reductase